MEPAAFIELVNTGVSIAILFFFIRGDVVSKKTVEIITQNLVSEIVTRVIKAFDGIIEQRDEEIRERLNRIEKCIQQDSRGAL